MSDETKRCPGCGEVGIWDESLSEFSEAHLPVLIYFCDNRECRVRDYVRTVESGTDQS